MFVVFADITLPAVWVSASVIVPLLLAGGFVAPLRRRLDARIPGGALDLMTDALEDSSRLPETLEVRMDGLRSGPLGAIVRFRSPRGDPENGNA